MKDADPLHPVMAQAVMPFRPPLTPCKHCGSLYCSPLRCRFDDMEALNRNEERHEPA